MQRGSAAALAAFLGLGIAVVSTQARGADGPRRFYDRQTECAVFDTAALAAQSANWDGPCTHGLASGRGTATFFGRDGASLAISADFRDGTVVDGKADLRWGDGAHYTGDVVDGRPDGAGVLVSAKGDRFEGAWKDGQLNGRGSVAWTNGDRYEGDWVAGKAEGHGVQVWADGQTYDGAWHDDQPNGQGIVTRKDGTQFTAMFLDGKRQVAEAATAPAAPAAAPAPAAPLAAAAAAPGAIATAAPPAAADTAAASPFDGMLGATLTGVDGSTVSVAASEGGVVRTLTAADGSVQKSRFTLLGTGLGSVADENAPQQVIGLFHVTPAGVQIDYGDGHSELLAHDAGGGFVLTARGASGVTGCAAWYPQGHVFSVAERKAAVAAYARRLGVAEAAPASATGCTAAAPVPQAHLPAPTHAPHHAAPPALHHTSLLAPAIMPAAKPAGSGGGLQPVPVKDSTVHLIDAPVAGPVVAPGVAAPPPPPPPADERVASNCLKVDSDGSYWGFRNHCGYSVQFAYCLLHGVDPMTACGDKDTNRDTNRDANGGAAGVPGSVSANGFGALFADDSIAERDADHAFRWVGCRGGAGEVIAELDHAEPASGQCVRTKTARREN